MQATLYGCAAAVLALGFAFGPTPSEQDPAPVRAVLGPQDSAPLDAELREPLFFAVLEGLYRDGVSNAVVDRMLEIDPATKYPANFVWACPICVPVIDALDVYRARPKFRTRKMDGDTLGNGLAAEVARSILEGDQAKRHAAIEALVQGWIGAYFDARRLTPEERQHFRVLMEEGRKLGLTYLESYRELGGTYASLKKCPSCEAGNGACKKP